MFKGRLSFSAFECYDQCPYKFKKQYIERVKTPNNKYAMFGSAFHNLIDEAYKNNQFLLNILLKQWPIIFEKESSRKEYNHIPSNIKKEQEERGYKDIKTWFKLVDGFGFLRPCIAHELSLKGKFKQLKLSARIDLVIDVKGGVGIIDWKTGTADRKNLMQLALYVALYYRRKGIKVKWLIPVYTKIKEVVFQECNKDIMKEASKYFNNIYDRLVVDKEFKPTKNSFCYFCGFRETDCPLKNK